MPKSEIPSEAQVQRLWWATTVERRHDAMMFDDPVLLKRIASAYDAIQFRQDAMAIIHKHLGVNTTPPSSEESKSLFDEAFVTVFVRSERRIIMMMPPPFLQREDFFDRIRQTLPDFLSPGRRRSPMPKARWKDIWATEPASIVAIEERVAMLVEQALWLLVKSSGRTALAECETDARDCRLEPWMLEHDQQIQKQKSPRKSGKKSMMKKRDVPCPARRDDKECVSVRSASPCSSVDVVAARDASSHVELDSLRSMASSSASTCLVHSSCVSLDDDSRRSVSRPPSEKSDDALSCSQFKLADQTPGHSGPQHEERIVGGNDAMALGFQLDAVWLQQRPAGSVCGTRIRLHNTFIHQDEWNVAEDGEHHQRAQSIPPSFPRCRDSDSALYWHASAH